MTVTCPNPQCGRTILVPLSPEEGPSCCCQGCYTIYEVTLGRLRSQSFKQYVRGSERGEWQVRYYVHPAYTAEAMLDFEGARDLELKSRDEFLILRDDSGWPALVVNRTVNRGWPQWRPRGTGGGCCAVVAVALLAAPAAVAATYIWS